MYVVFYRRTSSLDNNFSLRWCSTFGRKFKIKSSVCTKVVRWGTLVEYDGKAEKLDGKIKGWCPESFELDEKWVNHEHVFTKAFQKCAY